MSDENPTEAGTPPASSPSAKELNDLTDRIFQQREVVAQIDEQLSKAKAQLLQLEVKALAYLDQSDLESFRGRAGMISAAEKWTYELPKGDDKARFFGYLKSQGIFEEMATINHNTYNSYVQEELAKIRKEQGEEAAMHFRLPGVPEPKIHRYLHRTKKKEQT